MTDVIVAVREPEVVTVVRNDAEVINVVSGTDVVRVVATASTGPTGPQGPPGVSGASYVHDQAVPSAIWTITHNLGRFPSVTVVDSASSMVFGDVTYVSNNEITVTFGAAFGGRAFVN